jgi:hypothetical protein
MSCSLSAPLRCVLLRALAPLMAAATPVFAQSLFPPPDSMNDFSDTMLETPDTSMTIQPGDPSDPPYIDDNVTPDPNFVQPQEPYSPDLPDTVNSYEGPVGVTGIFNGNVTTGCSYDPLTGSAHRAIDDIVVPGSIGKYPLKMTRYYNSRQQYYASTAIGLSPGWAHEYSWLVWANGHKVVSPHGNVYDDSCGGPVGVSESWESHTSAGTGTWRLADGGRVHFDNYSVTYIEDPFGQRTRIAYNQSGPQIGQRVKVTEPGGRCLWFIYGDQNQGQYQGQQWGDGTWLVTRVEAYDIDGSPGTPNHPSGHLIDWVNYTYQVYEPINPPRTQRKQKMLRRVDYSDGTSYALYDYRTDNVPEYPTHKMYPVLQRCDDVRYNGPMRTIRYEYETGSHGRIINEKYPNVRAVSAITPGAGDSFTETRGDGQTRSFTYSHLMHCVGDDCDDPCAAYGESEPHNRMLDHYTDFQGHTTQLGYDQTTWYITSVSDANQHLTTYERGPAPPTGIGEIKKIIHHPDNSYIQYTYSDRGHYITSIEDENHKITTLHRDGQNRIQQIDYPTDTNTPPSNEGFIYNGSGQVLYHLLRNGAWESFAYDTRGLLIDNGNPNWAAPLVEMNLTPIMTTIPPPTESPAGLIGSRK